MLYSIYNHRHKVDGSALRRQMLYFNTLCKDGMDDASDAGAKK